jgi:hypothetical protein
MRREENSLVMSGHHGRQNTRTRIRSNYRANQPILTRDLGISCVTIQQTGSKHGARPFKDASVGVEEPIAITIYSNMKKPAFKCNNLAIRKAPFGYDKQ